MLIDLPTAKLHLRVDSTTEDTLVTLWNTAAETLAMQFLNRYVYADQDALDTAIAAVPATLATATETYDAAIIVADAMSEEVERESATAAAEAAYTKAQREAEMIYAGMVVNELIKAGILLILGHLFANREDVATGISVTELPMGSRYLLQPYRVGMGV